eukprot:c17437_g2_i1 orf=377-1840(-)
MPTFMLLGNIFNMHMKDGNDAGLSTSNEWEALISASLNKNPTTNQNNNNYHESNDNESDDVHCALKTIATKTSTMARTRVFYENDDDNGSNNNATSNDQCNSDNNTKSHDQYDGDGNAKSQDQCDAYDNTKLEDLYIKNRVNDHNNNIDNTNFLLINEGNKEGGDDNYIDGVVIDQHNSGHACQCGHYNFLHHRCADTNEKDVIPTSTNDEYHIYAQMPLTRKRLSLVELDSNPSYDEGANSSMFIRVARKQMVGLFISVWVRHSLQHHVKNVQVSSVGCGIMNRLGNKGSVSVSLSLHETSLCFICTHLRSGDKPSDVARRNFDVNNILRRTRFLCYEKLQSSAFNLPKTILAHDRIIWLGDLNYRLTLPPKVLNTFLACEDWKALLEKDELKKEKEVGGVFEGWHEGSICFAPTYKYRINSDTYCIVNAKEGSKRRAPAWCDRILWHGKGLKQLSYARCESKHSDHRPVRSLFMVEVESLKRLQD